MRFQLSHHDGNLHPPPAQLDLVPLRYGEPATARPPYSLGMNAPREDALFTWERFPDMRRACKGRCSVAVRPLGLTSLDRVVCVFLIPCGRDHITYAVRLRVGGM